jgi:hypothetical protein
VNQFSACLSTVEQQIDIQPFARFDSRVIKKISHFPATMLIHSILQHWKQHWWRITILAIAIGYHWLTLNKTRAGAKAKPAGGLGEAFGNAEYPTPQVTRTGQLQQLSR